MAFVTLPGCVYGGQWQWAFCGVSHEAGTASTVSSSLSLPVKATTTYRYAGFFLCNWHTQWHKYATAQCTVDLLRTYPIRHSSHGHFLFLLLLFHCLWAKYNTDFITCSNKYKLPQMDVLCPFHHDVHKNGCLGEKLLLQLTCCSTPVALCRCIMNIY